MKNGWDRVRFYCNPDDYRPVKWPPLGPYWCSGESATHSIVVAYFPCGASDTVIRKYWPEAERIDRMQTDTSLEFSDRFPKPTWWEEQAKEASK